MSQKWMDYSVPIPINGLVDASRVRARLAAQIATMPELAINAKIFNYAEDGKTLKGISPFRFGGGKLFHIYAAGNDAVDILRAEGHKITNLLSESYCSCLNEQRKTGFYGIETVSILHHFRIPLLVLQQHPAHYKMIMSMDSHKKNEYAENLIHTGIEHHIRNLNISFDLDDYGFIFGGTKITGDIFPVGVKPGVWFLAARNVTFRANIKLTGAFHVGHLISRGYGLITKSRTA